jgi:molybdopterin converting factor small subunit
MTMVTVKALGEISRIAGWEAREVEFNGARVEDLLKSISTATGDSLYQVLVEGGKLKDGYILSVNGKVITSLETVLNPGDRVATMEVVRLFHGG